MKKNKTYKIYSYPSVYSKKNGAVTRSICVEKDIPTKEAAVELSRLKYGNTKNEDEWRFGGLIYPTTYKIK